MYTTHATLLARVAADVDPRAWLEFHDRYGGVIRGFARRRGLQGADQDDVVQDVLLALTKSMRDFDYQPERGKFRSYLKTITSRVISRRLDQKRRATPLGSMDATLEDVSAGTLDHDWDEEWRQYHVRLAMQRLEAEFNENDRMAFAQYAMSGRAAGEVAAGLGISVDQVYQAKSRILKRLGELIAEQVADED